jgi:hypothetical protein
MATRLSVWNAGWITLIDRGVFEREIYPFLSNASKCTVTPRKDPIAKSRPISRIEGGYPSFET